MDMKQFVLAKTRIGGKKDNANEFHILLGADANYFPPLGIMVTSIIMNNPNEKIHFHLTYDVAPVRDLQKLEEISKQYSNIIIDLYKMDAAAVSDAVGEGMPAAAFYRIILAKELYPKIIYLLYTDVDALCIGRIRQFEQYDFGNKAFMAVEDTLSGSSLRQHRKDIALPDSYKYFNSGVLYINLARWHELGITDKAFDLLQERKQQGKHFDFYDQDALNIVAYNMWKELPSQYNLMIPVLREKMRGNIPSDTVILHFAADYKPWNLWTPEGDDLSNDCIELKLYDYYRSRSLWSDFKGRPLSAHAMRLLSRWMRIQGKYISALKWQYRYLKRKLKQ